MMNNQLPTVICLLPSVLRIFTTVESALQIDPFMQNKPNFQKSQMNVKSFHTVAYEIIANWTLGKNKPNSNPIRTQSKPIKPKTNPKRTQNKPNQTQFLTGCGDGKKK
jgi:hypothetical protein